MKKKLFSIMLAAVIMVSMVGCSSSKPENTVNEFLKNSKNFDLAAMNENISPDSQSDSDVVEAVEDNEDLKPYLKFFKKNVLLTEGQSFLLTPVIKPNTSNEQPLFDSDDPEIASVTRRGLLTALNPGSAKIRATLLSTGQTAVCTVYVREDDSSATAAPLKDREKRGEQNEKQKTT